MKAVTHSVGAEESNPAGRQPKEHMFGRLPPWGPLDENNRIVFFFSDEDAGQPSEPTGDSRDAAPFVAPAVLLQAYQPQGNRAGSPSTRQRGARAPELNTEDEAQHSSSAMPFRPIRSASDGSLMKECTLCRSVVPMEVTGLDHVNRCSSIARIRRAETRSRERSSSRQSPPRERDHPRTRQRTPPTRSYRPGDIAREPRSTGTRSARSRERSRSPHRMNASSLQPRAPPQILGDDRQPRPAEDASPMPRDSSRSPTQV